MKRKIRTRQYALFALGISLCLADAFLMVDGNVFGDKTIGIAIVVGIVGIGLISPFPTTLTLKNFEKSQSKTAAANNRGR